MIEAAFERLTDAYRKLTDLFLLAAYELNVIIAAMERGEHMCGEEHAALGAAGCPACKAKR